MRVSLGVYVFGVFFAMFASGCATPRAVRAAEEPAADPSLHTLLRGAVAGRNLTLRGARATLFSDAIGTSVVDLAFFPRASTDCRTPMEDIAREPWAFVGLRRHTLVPGSMDPTPQIGNVVWFRPEGDGRSVGSEWTVVSLRVDPMTATARTVRGEIHLRSGPDSLAEETGELAGTFAAALCLAGPDPRLAEPPVNSDGG